ncbi:MAG: glycosyltransferase family 39 protein, partial [Pyrinomonadaceae bacterium]
MPLQETQKRPRGVGILIAAHLAIALPMAYLLTIWTDEASTLYATQNGFWHAVQTAAIEQKQAPLYFWVISIWRMANDSIFFARLFSVLCSVVGIWLFARLAARLLGEKAALLAAAFFALHPYLFWASTEIRVYSLVILLSVALIAAFLDAFWDEDKPGTWPTLKFALLAIAALYTNYYLGGMLAALMLPLVLFRRWRSAAIYVGTMAAVGLAFLP